jgi:ribosomal-protein-serine acetyltransferase
MKIQIDDELYIAQLIPAHAIDLFNVTDKNRVHLRQWLSWLDLVKSIEDTETFIDTAIYQHNHGVGSSFAIFYADQLVGVAGYNQLDAQHHWGAIGYWLSESYTGKGIITQVVSKLIEYGFVEYQLHKIEIRCAEHNLKSRQIPERLGFTYEATLRDCEWLYDRYVNHAVYTLLKGESWGTRNP